MADTTLGYCGLFCGACGMYQATQAGKPVLSEEGAPLACDGCNSSRLTPWCADCAIKNCARGRGFRVCGQCPENPCEMLSGFMNDPKYPYHLAVEEDMRLLAEKGLPEFERLITERYTCRGCGTKVNWLSETCPSCNKALK